MNADKKQTRRIALSGAALQARNDDFAQRLGLGYAPSRIAVDLQMDGAYASRLARRPEIIARAAHWREHFLADQWAVIENTIAIAQLLVFRALTEDNVSPTEPEVMLARELLSKTVWRTVRAGVKEPC